MAKNERVIGGSIQYRRFAYKHKTDSERFGLLEAVDYQNARDHLGNGFYIRQVWLTFDEVQAQVFDSDRRREIVLSAMEAPCN